MAPGTTHVSSTLRCAYYWTHMDSDVAITVRRCVACARNRVKLSIHANSFQLFLSLELLQSVAIHHLGPLPLTKRWNLYLLIITDHFKQLEKEVHLRLEDASSTAKAFAQHWIFKYGPPQEHL